MRRQSRAGQRVPTAALDETHEPLRQSALSLSRESDSPAALDGRVDSGLEDRCWLHLGYIGVHEQRPDGGEHGRRRELDLVRFVAERPEVHALTACLRVP